MAKAGNVIKYRGRNINPFDIYIKKHHITRYQISQFSGVSNMTLSHAARRSVRNLECKYFMIIGEMAHKNPGTVMNEMIEEESELDKELGITEDHKEHV